MPDDDPPAWEGIGETWMTPQSEAAPFQRDAEAEARRARLAQAVLARAREIADSKRHAAKLWDAVQDELRRHR